MSQPTHDNALSMDPEEFRRLGHQVVDWIADYRKRAPELPVRANVRPGDVIAQLPSEPPSEPEGFEAVLADLDRIVVPALSHWQHPRFFGWFPSNSDLAAVLGDFLSTGLGVLGLSWQAAPALTEVEQVAVDWLRQMSGLSAEWRGVIQDTASVCTLLALVCARERHAAGTPLTVYTSRQAHSSVEKAAMLAGFRRENVRRVAVDAEFALDAADLARWIEEDRATGLQPCAIVATTGTTATTAMDPVAACAEIAKAHDLWLHVDAAMAGSAMLLPECRHLWHGVEHADSIVTNPHKWLGVSFDCSVFFVRDEQHLVRTLGTNPSYLRTADDGAVRNYRDWGIALGRRFRALKLWSLVRTHGTERLRARLRRDIDNARWLAEQAAATPPWRVLAPVPLQTVCLRHEPPGLTGEDLDRHTLEWIERLHASGAGWLTPAQLEDPERGGPEGPRSEGPQSQGPKPQGRWMARISIGALPTERRHVEQLWAAMRQSAPGNGAQDRI